jgi:formate C-acetyltransferase
MKANAALRHRADAGDFWSAPAGGLGPGQTRCTAGTAHGWFAACLSVAKLPYKDAQHGISCTVSIAPQKAHLSEGQLLAEAAKAFDVYFERGGFHMNLNVIDKEKLEDAIKNPDKYPQLTIRVSGYAVNFVRLTPEQQRDVISRTFHGQI